MVEESFMCAAQMLTFSIVVKIHPDCERMISEKLQDGYLSVRKICIFRALSGLSSCRSLIVLHHLKIRIPLLCYVMMRGKLNFRYIMDLGDFCGAGLRLDTGRTGFSGCGSSRLHPSATLWRGINGNVI